MSEPNLQEVVARVAVAATIIGIMRLVDFMGIPLSDAVPVKWKTSILIANRFTRCLLITSIARSGKS